MVFPGHVIKDDTATLETLDIQVRVKPRHRRCFVSPDRAFADK
jgi:hypothetical protein